MTDWGPGGLLDGLAGPARAARVRLLDTLAGEGVELEELRTAAAEDRLVLLLAERRLGGERRYSAAEVAEAAGVDLELLERLRHAQGLPREPDPEARALTERDVEAARSVRAFRDAGVSVEAMLAVTRVLGRGLAQSAEAMHAVTLDLALAAGRDEHDLALAHADVAARLAPLAGPLVAQLLGQHLRHVVQSELLSAAEREAGRLPGARDVAVAFADLVGFTRLGEEVTPDALGAVAGRLEELAAGRVEAPARIVKTLGDAVMLVAPDPADLVAVALDLVAAVDAEGGDFPQLRVGVAYGPALARAGDWFGSTVNLASRVGDRARPGSVLVTAEVRDRGGDELRFSRAGAKRLKGVAASVELFRARRAEAG